jgi:hypothetical protein
MQSFPGEMLIELTYGLCMTSNSRTLEDRGKRKGRFSTEERTEEKEVGRFLITTDYIMEDSHTKMMVSLQTWT